VHGVVLGKKGKRLERERMREKRTAPEKVLVKLIQTKEVRGKSHRIYKKKKPRTEKERGTQEGFRKS